MAQDGLISHHRYLAVLDGKVVATGADPRAVVRAAGEGGHGAAPVLVLGATTPSAS